ncbi:thioredoxin domain-containing protein [Flavihumibacter petaseus]|uniref:Spermatogenesis-associated protein 20-like TRX domain-containing protein n=1 Tax=Flavihumibacter petaseus NBRC 106054 TaxID=1220578 RepID=A0A0E9N5M9_9BACT|nr:thioredoxin domain-containing protein [Flavihumibacter petaseus]GAO45124.1 hypothetical protein FPE01S_04_03670 [Flavihumibacter petaseus NBRC 106054]
MNHLSGENSPYLLQHVHNPVDWYPWSEEALALARDQQKPILVSIGYAACHWCHVMERESFEDREVAVLMNKSFVNIKIDREERPDLDHIYMDAVQSMTGSGGWPLNVFLTPEGKPFYGGTYFPPRAAFNRPSWTDVLNGVSEAWENRREEIGHQAENLTRHLEQSSLFGQTNQEEGMFTTASVHDMSAALMQTADRTDGGFGRAPKFPQTQSIAFLLQYDYFHPTPAVRDHAFLSLDKMIRGGIYDQLGGGLARYATDNEWLIPHFEKMLYDQALFIGVLADASQVSHHSLYRETIDHTMEFVTRELLSPEGGFYAALDADSEGEEGKYYVWELGELEEVLGADAALAADWFGVTSEGNWEGINILTRKQDKDDFARKHGMETAKWEHKLLTISSRLMERRSHRIRPSLDDKQILSWNALMNTACSKAFAATGNEAYRELATRNMNWMLQVFQDPERGLRHTYKGGIVKFPGFLDDFAYLVQALIYLQEITGNQAYLEKAGQLTEWVFQHFGDETNNLFFYTSAGQKDVVVRKREIYDAAVPSGNAVMQWNLRYLGKILDRQEWISHASRMVASLGKAVTRYPGSFGTWASGWLLEVEGCAEIVAVGPAVDALRIEILANFIPNHIFQSATHENLAYPLLRNKPSATSLIYVCQNYSCLQPVETVTAMLRQL